jgi:hypothetical protein
MVAVGFTCWAERRDVGARASYFRTTSSRDVGVRCSLGLADAEKFQLRDRAWRAAARRRFLPSRTTTLHYEHVRLRSACRREGSAGPTRVTNQSAVGSLTGELSSMSSHCRRHARHGIDERRQTPLKQCSRPCAGSSCTLHALLYLHEGLVLLYWPLIL